MQNFFLVLQIILGIGLGVSIMMQSKGTGLGRAWGGSGMGYHSKRGVEKILFRFTIGLAILFFANSLVVLVV